MSPVLRALVDADNQRPGPSAERAQARLRGALREPGRAARRRGRGRARGGRRRGHGGASGSTMATAVGAASAVGRVALVVKAPLVSVGVGALLGAALTAYVVKGPATRWTASARARRAAATATSTAPQRASVPLPPDKTEPLAAAPAAAPAAPVEAPAPVDDRPERPSMVRAPAAPHHAVAALREEKLDLVRRGGAPGRAPRGRRRPRPGAGAARSRSRRARARRRRGRPRAPRPARAPLPERRPRAGARGHDDPRARPDRRSRPRAGARRGLPLALPGQPPLAYDRGHARCCPRLSPLVGPRSFASLRRSRSPSLRSGARLLAARARGAQTRSTRTAPRPPTAPRPSTAPASSTATSTRTPSSTRSIACTGSTARRPVAPPSTSTRTCPPATTSRSSGWLTNPKVRPADLMGITLGRRRAGRLSGGRREAPARRQRLPAARDRSGRPGRGERGPGGTVTITSVKPGESVSGAFEATFSTGTLQGSFNALPCPTGVEL